MLNTPSSVALIFGTLFSCSLFICSCDSSSSTDSSTGNAPTTAISGLGIDPAFQIIVDRFVIEANARNIAVDLEGLDIQFAQTNGALGTCSFLGTPTRDIAISNRLRDASDDLVSEIVLHELGHCILNRQHSSDPTSIMHATNIIGNPWRTSVLDELFTF